MVNMASLMSKIETIGSAVTFTDIEGYLLNVKHVKRTRPTSK